MADQQFVGRVLSLVTNSQIRYQGVLSSIDLASHTITLSSVRSFGTEGRAAPVFVPESATRYDYLQFKSDQISDLTMPEAPAPLVRCRCCCCC